jgi:proton glutamate symport protein
MKKMEKFGSPKEITSFVIPIGYTFNLDGSALYQIFPSFSSLLVIQLLSLMLRKLKEFHFLVFS